MMDQLGMVLEVEMTRLPRWSNDWRHLLEITLA
jgi:hypothetical protein